MIDRLDERTKRRRSGGKGRRRCSSHRSARVGAFVTGAMADASAFAAAGETRGARRWWKTGRWKCRCIGGGGREMVFIRQIGRARTRRMAKIIWTTNTMHQREIQCVSPFRLMLSILIDNGEELVVSMWLEENVDVACSRQEFVSSCVITISGTIVVDWWALAGWWLKSMLMMMTSKQGESDERKRKRRREKLSLRSYFSPSSFSSSSSTSSFAFSFSSLLV